MTSEKFLAPTPPAESQKTASRERELGSENGFQIWIADDVTISKMTSEKFLAPTPQVKSQKCVSRERKLGSENGFQMWIADDVSIPNMTLEKFLAQSPLAKCQKTCISGTLSRIGKRITDLDS